MDHKEMILKALPEPRNHIHLLLQSFHKSELENLKPRNETICLKCLTPWTTGQFTVTKITPANHRRKKRRQHQIERLQKEVKANDKKSSIVKLQRQLKHLQKQNSHIAIYKCLLCKYSTRVQLWKPKSKSNNQDIKIVTVVKDVKEAEASSTIETNKPKKNKGKKKKKNTAGLIIPPKRNQEQAQAVANNRLSMAKLSNMLQQSTTQSPMSKLNQFLK